MEAIIMIGFKEQKDGKMNTELRVKGDVPASVIIQVIEGINKTSKDLLYNKFNSLPKEEQTEEKLNSILISEIS